MPFIIQCPYSKCRMYNLLEDSARDTKVECLVCKGTIKVDASGSGERPPSSTGDSEPGSAPSPPRAHGQNVTNCPQCATPLRVPPNAKGKSIRCPRCQTVFSP